MARCTTESDGFHAHTYPIRDTSTGRCATITVHLHAWNDEHFKTWPDAKAVDVTTLGGIWGDYDVLGKYDTLAEAWAQHADGDIPAVDCKNGVSA